MLWIPCFLVVIIITDLSMLEEVYPKDILVLGSTFVTCVEWIGLDWIEFLFRLGRPLAWRLFSQAPSETFTHAQLHIHYQLVISKGSLMMVGGVTFFFFTALPGGEPSHCDCFVIITLASKPPVPQCAYKNLCQNLYCLLLCACS